jgi:membrane protein implicated in regulation of membrane protease activity
MSQPSQAQPPEHSNRVLAGFRELLEIIRDYGMPTVAFGTGIYAFILALQVQMAPEFKAGVALALTLLGILAQLWVYSRENPRVQSDEVKEQLTRMTNLVERLVETSIKLKSRDETKEA